MELNDEIRKLIMANADASVLTAGRPPQRHAQSARGRLAEDPRRRDHGGRSDARDAGVLMGTGAGAGMWSCVVAASGVQRASCPDQPGPWPQRSDGHLLLPRGRRRRQGPHRQPHRRRRKADRARAAQAGADAGLRRRRAEEARRSRSSCRRSAGGKRRDVLFFTQELSTLLNAGVPLDRALSHHRRAHRARRLPLHRARRAARAQGRQIAGRQPGHASRLLLRSVHQHGARGRGLGRAGRRSSSGWRNSSARATTCATTSSRR